MTERPVVQFRYELMMNIGLADGRLSIGSAHVDFDANSLTDALGDTLRGTLAIASGGDGEARWSFDDEPDEYRWILNRTGDELRVRILTFRDRLEQLPDDAGKDLFDATCAVTDFAGAIAAGAQRLLDRLGPEEYLRTWDHHPFPTEALAELQAWVRQSPPPGA